MLYYWGVYSIACAFGHQGAHCHAARYGSHDQPPQPDHPLEAHCGCPRNAEHPAQRGLRGVRLRAGVAGHGHGLRGHVHHPAPVARPLGPPRLDPLGVSAQDVLRLLPGGGAHPLVDHQHQPDRGLHPRGRGGPPRPHDRRLAVRARCHRVIRDRRLGLPGLPDAQAAGRPEHLPAVQRRPHGQVDVA